MRFDIVTVLPGLLDSPFAHSILQRAQKKGIAEIHVHNLRDYSTQKQKSVDDYPYGGGSGMVMTIEPFARIIEKLKSERDYDEVIFMSPDGDIKITSSYSRSDLSFSIHAAKGSMVITMPLPPPYG